MNHVPLQSPTTQLLNESTFQLCQTTLVNATAWRVESHKLANGATILDFGVNAIGGMNAGLMLARICMASRAEISLCPVNPSIGPWGIIQVVTDDPVHACMASQYAGWPVKKDKFFAMGSGPMRVKRGKEHVLQTLHVSDPSSSAVGVLECDSIPDDSIAEMIATECGVSVENTVICVAPTRSIAGTVQVVARSVETSMHKLFELGFDLCSVVSGSGTAPLPPPALDFVNGIGRTNDAILYGGHVTLWVNATDDQIQEIGPKVPSLASRDYGIPFANTFKKYEYDFYKVDPGLFSPAMITIVNLRSGRSFRYGALRPDILEQSFGELFVEPANPAASV
ncbi:MAG: methenyltetrahydromethanopterin cyclohydrolase [Planctomycetota bacterium]|nr:methenyltetrahydromethanopterin cyclohydrolase [Planctomycetota bacterium]